MKQKKSLAALLALVLALSLPPAVLASGSGDQTVNVTSTLNLPVLNVTIASPAVIVANPYKLSYVQTNDMTNYMKATDSLVSAAVLITSKTKVPVQVTVTPTVVANNVAIETDPTDVENESTPTVYMKLYIGPVAGNNSDPEQLNLADSDNVKSVVVGDTVTTSASAIIPKSQSGEEQYGAYKMTGKAGGAGEWKESNTLTVTYVFDIGPTQES